MKHELMQRNKPIVEMHFKFPMTNRKLLFVEKLFSAVLRKEKQLENRNVNLSYCLNDLDLLKSSFAASLREVRKRESLFLFSFEVTANVISRHEQERLHARKPCKK